MRITNGVRFGSIDHELPKLNREFQNATFSGGLKNIEEDDQDLINKTGSFGGDFNDQSKALYKVKRTQVEKSK